MSFPVRIAIAIASLVVLGFFLIPNYGCSCTPRWRVYRAAVKGDLRNLVTAQESYFADSRSYTDDVQALNYATSTGVRLRVIEASDSGFVALALHTAADGKCAVWVGKVAEKPLVADSVGTEGEPYCNITERRD